MTYTLPVEMDLPVYAIGDIHGNQKSMNEAIEWCLKKNGPKTIVFLGDIINRGPNSIACVNDLLALHKTENVIILRGNHEIMAQYSLDESLNESHRRDYVNCWIRNGGHRILEELWPTMPKELTNHQIEEKLRETFDPFFALLQNNYKRNDFVFIHGGLTRRVSNLGVALNYQWNIPITLVNENTHWAWTRETAFSNIKDSWFKKFIVHGHTPVQKIRGHNIPFDISCWHVNMDYGSSLRDDGFVNVCRIEGNEIEFFKER